MKENQELQIQINKWIDVIDAGIAEPRNFCSFYEKKYTKAEQDKHYEKMMAVRDMLEDWFDWVSYNYLF